MKNANSNLLIYLDKFARRGSHAARARGEYIYIIHSRVAVLSQNISKFNLTRKLYHVKGFHPFVFSFSKRVRLRHKRLPYFMALQRWRTFSVTEVQSSLRAPFEQSQSRSCM